MNIGGSIRTLRNKKGLSQGELSSRLGITQTYLSMIENGKKSPRFDLVVKIAEKLELPLFVLIFHAREESDIQEHKRDAYQLMDMGIKTLIESFIERDSI